MAALAEARPPPVVEEHRAQRPRQFGQRTEVGVVALPFAGERGMQAVVDVVVPLRGQAVAPGAPRDDQTGIVEIGLGDQRQRPSQVRGKGVHLGGQFLQHVAGTGVAQRVHGVQPQAIEVVVAQPLHRVVDDVAAHLVGMRAVQVEGGSPNVASGEIGSEAVQIRARWTEMVVHDVEDHAQPTRVAGVHEALEAVWPAVVLGDGVPAHPVVAPVAGSVNGVDRHHLN